MRVQTSLGTSEHLFEAERLLIAHIDNTRAHFYAPATRPIRVDLVCESAREGSCARPLQRLYETRDAT